MKIVLSTVAALFLLGCSDGSTDAVKETAATQSKELKEKSKELATKAKEAAAATSAVVIETTEVEVKNLQDESEKVAKELKSESAELVKEVKTQSAEVAKEIKESVKEVRTDVAKAIEPVKEPTPVEAVAAAPKASIDAAALYKTCIACHGVNAEKKALNKSQIIQGWESSKTIAALNGYKDGSYGSTMKGVMKPQVMKLSDAEIEALAKYISGL